MAKLFDWHLRSLDVALAAEDAIDQVNEGGNLSDTGGREVARLCWLGFLWAALTVSGCDGQPRAVALPSVTETGTPQAPSSTAEDQRAVVSAYTAFVAMLDRADSLPSGTRRAQLATVMVDPQLSRVLRRVDEMKRHKIATYGRIIVHVKSVRLTASGATVFDCQDSRDSGLVNLATGKKINRGVRQGEIKALLVKGPDGQWRVSKTITIGEGC